MTEKLVYLRNFQHLDVVKIEYDCLKMPDTIEGIHISKKMYFQIFLEWR